jgi:hypothetical protein
MAITLIVPVYGVIVGRDTSEPAFGPSIGYTADVHTPEGVYPGVRIGRPAVEIWRPPMKVVPFPADGTVVVHGVRDSSGRASPTARFIWQWMEAPYMVDCDQLGV